MIDVNKIKVGDKLRVIADYLKGCGVDEIVEVVPFVPDDYWINGGFVDINYLDGEEEAFELIDEESEQRIVPERITTQKIKVLTSGYEYQGLYKGSVHTVESRFDDGVQFWQNNRLWTLSDNDYEDYEEPLILDAKPYSGLDRQETPKKATEFLSKALSLLEERGKDYDQPEGERSMGKTVVAFNAITGNNLKESDGWLILQLLKDVRQNQNRDSYHADSAEDCISYAALKAEALAEGK